MDIVRAPDDRFVDLPDFPFAPRYVNVDGLRMHTVDEGPRDAPPVLLLHGEPSWSYLHRKMIPPLVAAGHRVVAPDLIGFGRSDKPVRREEYTYQRHVDWTRALLAALDLRAVTMFCQDWGGLIGLRLVAEDPGRYARVVAANTFLPTGREPVPKAFLRWRQFSQESPDFRPGAVVTKGCARPVAPAVAAAYDAPFPDERHLAGARQFPMLVPVTPEDPGAAENRAAWEVLLKLETPFLTAFGDSDPITRGADLLFQAAIPGARGQPHTTIARGGHFVQEDAGEELARIVAAFAAPRP